jgi:hypothetical protein
MKLSKVIVTTLVGMSFVSGAWAAQKNAAPVSPDVTTTPTEYYGTIEVTLAITIKSAIASTTPIYCTASLTVGSYLGGAGQIIAADESAAAPATASGGKETCVIKIPYFWYLAGTTEDQSVSLTTSVIAGVSANIATEVGRTSTRTIGPFPIPAAGATTSFAYTIYL